MAAQEISTRQPESCDSIRVLVVDDSPTMRHLLQEIINRQPDMRVVGTAPDPHVARAMIKELHPDILTLDIEMPGMDGIDFLERVMRLRPMPVLMVSGACSRDSELAKHALDLGAVDFVTKRTAEGKEGIARMAEEIAVGIRAASPLINRNRRNLEGSHVMAQHSLAGLRFPSGRVIFIGASTGGTEAIKDFLMALPRSCPPVMVAQHMPENFTASFARRLDGLTAVRVKEAENNEELQTGTVYIAPGHSHLLVRRCARGALKTELSKADPVNRHRPSVDVLFDSAAKHVGKHAAAVILTGMGRDGAAGLQRMHEAGAFTGAQDEKSCIVYGMPRAAVELGAVDIIGPPQKLATEVLQQLAVKVVTAPA